MILYKDWLMMINVYIEKHYGSKVSENILKLMKQLYNDKCGDNNDNNDNNNDNSNNNNNNNNNDNNNDNND